MEADAEHLNTLDQVRAQADEEEDLWGSGIIRLLRGIAAHKANALDDAAAAFDRLGAPVLQLWANCLAAVVAGDDRPHRMQQSRIAAKILGARGVLEMAEQWANLATDAALPPQLQLPPAAAQLRVLGAFELAIGGAPVDQSAVRPRARQALHLLALHAGRSGPP